MGRSVSWLITILLLLITMLANVRARSKDFDGELSFGNGLQLPEGDEEDERDEDLIESASSSRFPVWRSQGAGRIPVNVDSFGAVGDGNTDDTKAFLSAWDKACSLDNAVFLVPEQRHYKVNATRFRGPCQRKLIIQVGGTIVAPEEPKNWDPKNPRVWLVFSNLEGIRIQGGGVIDGSGSKWWAASSSTAMQRSTHGIASLDFTFLHNSTYITEIYHDVIAVFLN